MRSSSSCRAMPNRLMPWIRRTPRDDPELFDDIGDLSSGAASSVAPRISRPVSPSRLAGRRETHHRGLSQIPHPQPDLTETTMSRTIKFAQAGGPAVLEFVEVQVPAPGPNEVRIKVKAIGINRAEAMWRAGDYNEPGQKFPAGLGFEAPRAPGAVGKERSGLAGGGDVH